MSSLVGTIKQIKSCDSLHIIDFELNDELLSMMSLDIDESLEVGSKVKLSFKPTHVAIGKAFEGLVSYSNQLRATIVRIENGELLTKIKLQFFDSFLESIITYESSKRMDLKIGDEVIAFIKASEISIDEVLDD